MEIQQNLMSGVREFSKMISMVGVFVSKIDPMRFSFRMGVVLAFSLLITQGCVPKTQYDDQQSKLDEAHAKLKSMENNTADCDRDTFMQLREQAQSMELLNQELLGRNTELSKEIARLKVSDSQTRSADLTCERQLDSQIKEFEAKMARTQATYEDLIKDLKQQIEHLKADSRPKVKNSRPKAPSQPAMPAKN